MARTWQVAALSQTFSKTDSLRKKLEETVAFSGGEVRFAPPSPAPLAGQELIDFVGDSQVIVVGREKIDAAFLKACPKLKAISKYGVGIDNIDLDALSQNNIEFYWQGGVNAQSVAELAVGMAISLLRRVQITCEQLRQGLWDKNGGREFSGRSIGVVGCGQIGKRVLGLAQAFGCELFLCDIEDRHDLARQMGARQLEYSELLKRCEVITFHVPLTDLTHHMFADQALQEVRPGAVILNTSRGPVTDIESLTRGLESGVLGGVGLDVYETEPLGKHAILEHPKFLGTPHIGGSSHEAIQAMGRAAIEGVGKALASL